MLFDLFGSSEKRSLENPKQSIADPANWHDEVTARAANIEVSESRALGVPAIFQAVNSISGTIANLPLHLYKVDKNGESQKAIRDPLYYVVHDRANDVHTKSAFFKWIVWRALAGSKGRGLALITRDGAGRVAGFLPLDESAVTIEQTVIAGRLNRAYVIGTKRYEARDIIDIAPIAAPNCRDALSPILVNRTAIAAIIAAEAYATGLFANGGVPPLTLSGTFASPASADRATEQLSSALRQSRDQKRMILPTPPGFELKPLGFDPAKQQLIELRRFQISEVSRIFNVAPAMLHDLSTGTYSNTEQQSLNFATQTILPLVKIIEQELNLKLFGNRNTSNYVEFNVDALVRGDLKSRMEALARAVNAALITPDEARALDNRPSMPGGDRLYIQGATVPLETAGQQEAPAVVEPEDDFVEDESASIDDTSDINK